MPRPQLRYRLGTGLARPAPTGLPAEYVTGPTDTGFYNRPGYPGGAGDKTGASLTDGSGVTIVSDTTYSNYKNLGLGQIGTPSVPVHNVTFNSCCWESSGYSAPNVILCTDGAATFNYCTVRPVGLSDNTAAVSQTQGYQYAFLANGTVGSPGTYNSFSGGPLSLYYCDVWGYANVSLFEQSNISRPLYIEGMWVHNSRTNDDTLDHTDGIGCPAGGVASYVTVTKCRVEDDGDTQGLAWQNTPGPSVWDHFTITNNLLGGWGFTVNVSGGTAASPTGGTNITFTDNTFSTKIKPIYGPLYDNLMATGSGNLWRRNKWSVPAGAAWGNPAHDGWYWMPVSTNIPVGDSDSAFVSATDFTG